MAEKSAAPVVLRGFNVGPNDDRYEPGDPVPEGLPLKVRRLLVEAGAIPPFDELSLDTLKRDELNQRAQDAGVDSPEDLPSKQAVIDSINDAEGGES